MIEIGELREVGLRKAWDHEAQSFAPWLCEHLDRLGKQIDIPLEFVRREAPVERFSADILAHNMADDSVVLVENQLETSDHRQVGQRQPRTPHARPPRPATLQSVASRCWQGVRAAKLTGSAASRYLVECQTSGSLSFAGGDTPAAARSGSNSAILSTSPWSLAVAHNSRSSARRGQELQRLKRPHCEHRGYRPADICAASFKEYRNLYRTKIVLTLESISNASGIYNEAPCRMARLADRLPICGRELLTRCGTCNRRRVGSRVYPRHERLGLIEVLSMLEVFAFQ